MFISNTLYSDTLSWSKNTVKIRCVSFGLSVSASISYFNKAEQKRMAVIRMGPGRVGLAGRVGHFVLYIQFKLGNHMQQQVLVLIQL